MDSFRDLQALYDSVPGVPCLLSCGMCCATPAVTPVEFMYLFARAREQYSTAEMTAFLEREMQTHPWGGNNFLCCFQDRGPEKKCLVHPYRPLACRLFGLPVLIQLGLENLERCPVMDPQTCPQVPREALDGWLSRIKDLNQDIPGYYAEPYWVLGLNLESWLAVYFDPLLDVGVFGALKRRLRQAVDLDFFQSRYRDHTRLKEKVDKISLFYLLFSQGLVRESRETLASAVHDYPATGTYFAEEGKKLLEIVDSRMETAANQ